MAINYPYCEWVISSQLLEDTENHKNFTTDEIEQQILEDLGSCKDFYNYIKDDFVITMITLYSIIIPVGFFGNLTVILLILTTKALQRNINFFLLSVAVSDFILTLCLPWALINHISYDYGSSEMLCHAVPPIQGTALMTTIYCLLAIAVERHQAIVYPTHKKLFTAAYQVGVVILTIWLLSFCVQIPLVVVMRVSISNDTIHFAEGIEVHQMATWCYESWTDHQRFAFSIAIIVIMYAVPLLALIVLYSRICYFLLRRRTVVNVLSERTAIRLRKRNQKLIMMFILIVIAFAVLWGPYFIIQCWNWCVNDVCNPELVPYLQMLGHANVAVNPLVYAAMHERIREHLIIKMKKVGTCCRSVCFKHGRVIACGRVNELISSDSDSTPQPVSGSCSKATVDSSLVFNPPLTSQNATYCNRQAGNGDKCAKQRWTNAGTEQQDNEGMSTTLPGMVKPTGAATPM